MEENKSKSFLDQCHLTLCSLWQLPAAKIKTITDLHKFGKIVEFVDGIQVVILMPEKLEAYLYDKLTTAKLAAVMPLEIFAKIAGDFHYYRVFNEYFHQLIQGDDQLQQCLDFSQALSHDKKFNRCPGQYHINGFWEHLLIISQEKGTIPIPMDINKLPRIGAFHTAVEALHAIMGPVLLTKRTVSRVLIEMEFLYEEYGIKMTGGQAYTQDNPGGDNFVMFDLTALLMMGSSLGLDLDAMILQANTNLQSLKNA